jgi:hypothetical protein
VRDTREPETIGGHLAASGASFAGSAVHLGGKVVSVKTESGAVILATARSRDHVYSAVSRQARGTSKFAVES